jgi:hypothetical protein
VGTPGAGGNGTTSRSTSALPPSAAAEPSRIENSMSQSAPATPANGEVRRRRWVAALIMAISMLITMLLFLYAGYWLYHQKKQPFSSLPQTSLGRPGTASLNPLRKLPAADR